MSSIHVDNNILTIKLGFKKEQSFDMEKLRLNYLVTETNIKFFSSKSDIATVDLDNKEQEEALNLFNEAFKTQKPWVLSSINICLADYSENRLVVGLHKFKKADINIFEILKTYREKRISMREEWLKTNPSVFLKNATLNKEGFKLSEKKSISWNDVKLIQKYVNESLITSISILMIPEGVGTGHFGIKKFKYSIRGVPKKLADLYLAECIFWKNLAAVE
jgi:hypothetical protein